MDATWPTLVFFFFFVFCFFLLHTHRPPVYSVRLLGCLLSCWVWGHQAFSSASKVIDCVAKRAQTFEMNWNAKRNQWAFFLFFLSILFLFCFLNILFAGWFLFERSKMRLLYTYREHSYQSYPLEWLTPVSVILARPWWPVLWLVLHRRWNRPGWHLATHFFFSFFSFLFFSVFSRCLNSRCALHYGGTCDAARTCERYITQVDGSWTLTATKCYYKPLNRRLFSSLSSSFFYFFKWYFLHIILTANETKNVNMS